jgi:hypothetical protein
MNTPWPTTSTPRNVYINEADIVPALSDWIPKAFEPSNIRTTLAALHNAQNVPYADAPAGTTPRQTSSKPATKHARYRAVLDGGGDPAIVTAWDGRTTAERAAALARQKAQADRRGAEPGYKLTISDLELLVGTADPSPQTSPAPASRAASLSRVPGAVGGSRHTVAHDRRRTLSRAGASMSDVLLRDVDDADLEVFYEQQREKEAVQRAQFPPATGTTS